MQRTHKKRTNDARKTKSQRVGHPEPSQPVKDAIQPPLIVQFPRDRVGRKNSVHSFLIFTAKRVSFEIRKETHNQVAHSGPIDISDVTARCVSISTVRDTGCFDAEALSCGAIDMLRRNLVWIVFCDAEKQIDKLLAH